MTTVIAHLPRLVAPILATSIPRWFENHTMVQMRLLYRAVFIPLPTSRSGWRRADVQDSESDTRPAKRLDSTETCCGDISTAVLWA